MLDLARGNFPSELIFKMPDVMIKQFSQLYPREKRTELVLILDDEYRSKYVNIIAPNQKTKDMIELDLANYETNQVLKEKVLENKDALMQEFILHCRKQISTNPSHLKELQPLLIEWLDSFQMNEKAQDQKDVLKIAA
jgi:hypothetical protein